MVSSGVQCSHFTTMSDSVFSRGRTIVFVFSTLLQCHCYSGARLFVKGKCEPIVNAEGVKCNRTGPLMSDD